MISCRFCFLFFYFMCKSLQILASDGAVSKVSYLHAIHYFFPSQMWKQHFTQKTVVKLSKGMTALRPRDNGLIGKDFLNFLFTIPTLIYMHIQRERGERRGKKICEFWNVISSNWKIFHFSLN